MKSIPFDGGMVCPECGKRGLSVVAKEEMGSDGDWDEVQIQVVHCDGCRLHSLAQYLESRRGGRDLIRHEIVEPEEAHIKELPDAIVHALGH